MSSKMVKIIIIIFFQNLRKDKPLTPKRSLSNNMKRNYNFNFMVKNKEMQIQKP